MSEWLKLLWNPKQEAPLTKEEKLEESSNENSISEPVRAIVKAMITDRKRFIFQVDVSYRVHSSTQYSVLDIDTEEEFFVISSYWPGLYSDGTHYYGPEWAGSKEIEWAVKTVASHYENVTRRAKRITAARERNRLIEIYAR